MNHGVSIPVDQLGIPTLDSLASDGDEEESAMVDTDHANDDADAPDVDDSDLYDVVRTTADDGEIYDTMFEPDLDSPPAAHGGGDSTDVDEDDIYDVRY